MTLSAKCTWRLALFEQVTTYPPFLRPARAVTSGPLLGTPTRNARAPGPCGVSKGTNGAALEFYVPFRWPVGLYLGLLALSGLAFWPKYLSRLDGAIDPYTHAHAILAVAWCSILIFQPVLAARGLEWHRWVGRASWVIAPAFVTAALLLASQRFRTMDDLTFHREAASLFLPLSAVCLFAFSYAFGIYHRRQRQLHARFMLLTGLPMIDPVLGRVLFFYGPAFRNPLVYQAITFGITDVVILALLFLPRPSPRPLGSFGLPAAAFPVAHMLWFTFAQTQLWVPIASWFRALPLT